MVANHQLRVRQGRLFDGLHQLTLELLDPLGCGHPTPHHRRLDDDALHLGRTVKGPCRLLRPHGSSSVEHELRVLLGVHDHTVAKLPVQHNGPVAYAANQVSRAEHTRQQVAKANARLGSEVHLLCRVNFAQQSQRRLQLLAVVFAQRHTVEVLVEQAVGTGVTVVDQVVDG